MGAGLGLCVGGLNSPLRVGLVVARVVGGWCEIEVILICSGCAQHLRRVGDSWGHRQGRCGKERGSHIKGLGERIGRDMGRRGRGS